MLPNHKLQPPTLWQNRVYTVIFVLNLTQDDREVSNAPGSRIPPRKFGTNVQKLEKGINL